MRGLNKGGEELMKMTTKYLLRAPIMFILITHHEHGPSFLRALLSILHNKAKENEYDDVLIHDESCPNWGKFSFEPSESRTDVEEKWYNILEMQSNDAVYWWLQFGLNMECLKLDLQ